ncbi:alpha/beta hydrolase [Myxococcus sp. RHSTA-1-4]|uniref:alpha/beta hydrolase n=1 Tax=Myxococcus sp. RHSTA-1-4 TaxID=2874601 RepID=UPI001CBC5C74|nr:alpha/beta fold hydrolase [Myxococcus sp. RHSTA-1-4]MBZ4422560.1 alpha/beta fold hydrolase [Myxococcus sp. RHSTA-1-4]
MPRLVRLTLTCLLLLGLGGAATGALTARSLTRRAAPRFPEPPPPGWEAVSLTSGDGTRLGGWLRRGDSGTPCVLALHGNGSSRTGLRHVLDVLSEDGTCVLALSLRAHGDSDGEVNDFGWSAARDVRAGIDFLQRELPERRRLVFGTSLGAAAALYAARDMGTRVDGYALESPYRDLRTAVRNRLRMRLGPAEPLAFATLWPWGAVTLPVDPTLLRPVDAARSVPASVPVLLLAGERDAHALPEEVSDIAANVPGPVRLERFAGAVHGRLQSADPERYHALLRSFVAGRR